MTECAGRRVSRVSFMSKQAAAAAATVAGNNGCAAATSSKCQRFGLLLSKGGPNAIISDEELANLVLSILPKDRKKIVVVPPDITRFHSRAGIVTNALCNHFGDAISDVIPALGTHTPMTPSQLNEMYADVPKDKVRIHDWRNDVVTLGEVEKEAVEAASNGHLRVPWPVQINKLLRDGGHDLIVSVGQMVPHEVMGMANYNKNLFVGTGGADSINLSHFIGAAYGMERMMGRKDNPLRRILQTASERFVEGKLPVVYVLTVVGRDDSENGSGELVTRGVFVGDDIQCYNAAADLSLQVNFTMVPKPLDRVVVWLDPVEFHSTWLGNKSIYRTRMAIADGGTLIVLAPGVRKFGEDGKDGEAGGGPIDTLIRKYGYRTTPEVMAFLKANADIKRNLSAAAHLIHGSSDGRFNVIYAPGGLSKADIESVGYEYGDLEELTKKYQPEKLKEGFNTLADGERFYFVGNPAVGLWAAKVSMIQERKWNLLLLIEYGSLHGFWRMNKTLSHKHAISLLSFLHLRRIVLRIAIEERSRKLPASNAIFEDEWGLCQPRPPICPLDLSLLFLSCLVNAIFCFSNRCIKSSDQKSREREKSREKHVL